MIRPAVTARRIVGIGLPVAVVLATLLPSAASAQVPETPELPVPAPDLPVPDVPAPDLPTPDLPVPDLPAPDLPGIDALRACVEEAVAAHDPGDEGAALVEAIMACIAGAGLPDLPAPDLPAPDLPAPDLPVPELPTPGLPGGLPGDVPSLPGGLPVQAPDLPTGLPVS